MDILYQIIIYGHGWNQIRILDENGNVRWCNYDLTNDPGIINDDSQNILENDETFYTRFIPSEWEKVEKCTQSISNDIIHNASLQRTLKGNKFEQLLTNGKFVTQGQYSGKKITKQDIGSILDSLTWPEIIYITDLLQQTVKQPELAKNEI